MKPANVSLFFSVLINLTSRLGIFRRCHYRPQKPSVEAAKILSWLTHANDLDNIMRGKTQWKNDQTPKDNYTNNNLDTAFEPLS
jgi:hypothetical protein